MKVNGFLAMTLLLLPQLACENSNFNGSAKQAQAVKKEADQTPLPAEPQNPGDAAVSTPEKVVDEPAKPLDPGAIFFECGNDDRLKFVADLYELPEGTKNLPNFSDIKSIKQICLKQIDIAPRGFEDGFPGVDNLFEWFALNIKFKVSIPADGEYRFRINSDDGAKLFVDGEEVIDNDGQHAPKSEDGKIKLKAGTHEFNVQYFQGPRFNIALELFMTAPGAAESYIPVELVSRP